ncbi:MAG: hypothetical protein ACJ0F6_02320 [Acidimicrobiales bacterium]
MQSPLYVTVFPVPSFVPELVIHTEARGNRRIAETLARFSAQVIQIFPSWFRYETITPTASPFLFVQLNTHSR